MWRIVNLPYTSTSVWQWLEQFCRCYQSVLPILICLRRDVPFGLTWADSLCILFYCHSSCHIVFKVAITEVFSTIKNVNMTSWLLRSFWFSISTHMFMCCVTDLTLFASTCWFCTVTTAPSTLVHPQFFFCYYDIFWVLLFWASISMSYTLWKSSVGWPNFMLDWCCMLNYCISFACFFLRVLF